MAIAGLITLYSITCLAGLITELNWRGKRWMPLVAPFNTLMAGLWVIVLIGLASPLTNSWAISANSQYKLVAEEKITAADFDYSYLRFELGEYGEAALDKLLALTNHPEAQTIQDRVTEVRTAKDKWDYRRIVNARNGDGPVPIDPVDLEAMPEGADDAIHPGASSGAETPMELEINPAGADTGPDDPDADETSDDASDE